VPSLTRSIAPLQISGAPVVDHLGPILPATGTLIPSRTAIKSSQAVAAQPRLIPRGFVLWRFSNTGQPSGCRGSSSAGVRKSSQKVPYKAIPKVHQHAIAHESDNRVRDALVIGADHGAQAFGIVESAVEPTRSANMTVRWRRSASSLGIGAGGD